MSEFFGRFRVKILGKRAALTDNYLLASLRHYILDENEPLAGLLRKCLLLGAETGSDSLRQWARRELNGYDEGDELPAYRKLPTPPLSADTVSGRTWVSNMKYSVLQLPTEARDAIGDEFPLRLPVEELEQIATTKSPSFTNGLLSYAEQLWNEQLGPFERVVNLRFTFSGSIFVGVLGQIRTQLIEMMADLTADTPFTELPTKNAVDAAVTTHIGVQYNTNIQSALGPTAVGSNAGAKTEGLSVNDAIKLLDGVKDASVDVQDEVAKSDLISCLQEIRDTLQSSEPSTKEVVEKVGKLKAIAAKVGSAGLDSAVSGVVEGITTMVMSGAFG